MSRIVVVILTYHRQKPIDLIQRNIKLLGQCFYSPHFITLRQHMVFVYCLFEVLWHLIKLNVII
jgi:hypothetical protein